MVVRYVACFILPTIFLLINSGSKTEYTIDYPAKKIVETYGGIFGIYKSYSKENIQEFVQYRKLSKTHLELFNTMQNTEKVIHYVYREPTSVRNSEPNEIYSIFEYFDYLKRNNKHEYNQIIAVSVAYRAGGIGYEREVDITISKNEYEKLLREVDDADDGIVVMSKQWCLENTYNRYGLTMEDESWNRLMSPWRTNIESPDSMQQYSITYSSDVVLISKVRRDSSGNRVSTAPMPDIDTGEQGYIFAAWDDDLGLWIYGETIGLRYFRYIVDEDQFLWQEDVPIKDEVPPVLIQVMFRR